MQRYLSCLFLALVILSSTGAQALETNAPVDAHRLLGATPDQVYQLLGAPIEIYPLQIDAKRWQVIHLYGDFRSLFWYGNHVWQVWMDQRFTGTFQGLQMGDSKDSIVSLLGPPLGQAENWAVWTLAYKTFPRRLRLVFDDSQKLTDIFVYRSDF